MCLIIAPNGEGQKALLPREAFDYAYSRNKDGFGAMWTEDGRVNHFKSLGLSGDEIYAYMEEYVEKYPDVIFHLRLKTHGKVTPSLCHPFRILHKSRHGRDMFFMHNGILGAYGNGLTYGQSDTTSFKDKVLVPLLTRDPDALDDPAIMDSINKLTTGSRLVFMDSNGKVWRTSGATWNTEQGPLCSNTYMLPNKPYVPLVSSGYGSYPNESDDGKVVTMGRPYSSVGQPIERDGLMYSVYRMIEVGATQKPHWCAKVADGYLRTETGLLYKDRGDKVMLKHSLDYIPKDQEFQHLAGFRTIEVTPTEDDDTRYERLMEEAYNKAYGDDSLDDDLPWDEDTLAEHTQMYAKEEKLTTTVGEQVANLDERLRYARLVHNTQGSGVMCREQLLGDLIGMSTDEMERFIKEDSTTAHVVMAELIEIVCEQNDWLSQDETLKELAFDAETVMSRGNLTNHQDNMRRISAMRKELYQKKLAERTAREEAAKPTLRIVA